MGDELLHAAAPIMKGARSVPSSASSAFAALRARRERLEAPRDGPRNPEGQLAIALAGGVWHLARGESKGSSGKSPAVGIASFTFQQRNRGAMGILPALFSLHYNVTKVRADGGDDGFKAWGVLRNALAAREALQPPPQRLLQRIMPPETAVATLDAFFQNELPALHTALHAAQAADDRGAVREIEFRLAAVTRAQQEAIAVLAEATYFLDKAQNQAKADRFWKLLNQLDKTVDRVILKDYLHIDNNGFSVSVPKPISFSWTKRTVDCAGKTTVAATGANPAAPSLFTTYAVLSDPAVWSANNPNAFRLTFPASTDLAVVTALPTNSLPKHDPGTTWEDHLFEDADMAVIPDESPTEFRNLLNVSFTSDGQSEASLDYSLYESLTTSFFGIDAQGGIDVDSGTGSVTFGRRDGAPPGLVLSADKSIRFSEACPFSEFFNVIALPWLTWWMADLVLLGLES
jgi:hypothetical protein